MESELSPYIRCKECHHGAFINWEWRPSRGINPLMRKWVCKAGHDTYWAMTLKDMARLQVA